MINYDDLRAKAEAAMNKGCSFSVDTSFRLAADPTTVLALLDDIDTAGLTIDKQCVILREFNAMKKARDTSLAEIERLKKQG